MSNNGFVNFDTDGKWDNQNMVGPAVHTPQYVRNTIIIEYRIEWLNMSEPENDFYSKNHMVASAIFARPLKISNENYASARISMELSEDSRPVDGVNPVCKI
ncbi:hypothetical protein DRE_04185 [Drechslerella stenobrocha 248]|uniref:Uncharacterized protein n=1 Tax=Drechslerella stenobrocha 248 TaxID=1043628 RepID=W7I3D0_9PEZI|nr:hypothetical protein DRE_04185 [Drechslerella stenobrocha 248]